MKPPKTTYQVNISYYFNNSGVATANGQTGNYDGGGNAYVGGSLLANQSLSTTIAGQPVSFHLAPMNSKLDNIRVNGEIVNINSAKGYHTLWILGSATNVSGSSRQGQIKITYVDDTSTTLPFQLSDWIVPGSKLPSGESSVGNIATNRTNQPGNLYVVGFPIDPTEKVSFVQFNDDPNIHIWAITLTR